MVSCRFLKTCMGVLPVEALDPPELELKMVSLHADECWERSLGPLEKHPALLIPEPSLQPYLLRLWTPGSHALAFPAQLN